MRRALHSASQRLGHAIGFAVGLTLLVWLGFGMQQLTGLTPGIVPRTWQGLIPLPFIFLFHANGQHLLVNSVALVPLATLFALRMQRWTQACALTLVLSISGGLIVWLIGSPGVHLGASLLVFAYLGFLLGGFHATGQHFGTLLWRLLLAGLALYLFWPLLPQLLVMEDGVSWSAHAGGALAGLLWGIRRN
ncbi:MAG: rhomboid family intramembrane serine protease [Candidatus Dactylopiibacterium carminicum]|uniref:Rhomboid family intramembrane serine protease n=1 Tax=Candidatus Dactylopiibacterium carminicum TaxID=857335 RepID=A0A272EQF3_9RHOO|nr:rhomboid family intramembrane serine protease [Candidatus Dactylopiibacterium carminicum]KAF7598570.1 rhomboid family intramembrane serine protease [Candidatus Dactylopiibacterium carminicum]PAS92296.1 MAG: rhomboid family intramembrane serine protease [Candidatus Dactylopiibacterium carminicum]PAS92702.1 MAG: rhomboid family intramembrane serine protease [Candidatus Dactylopiibacterium carminicum]PAS98231.1 MAG: hypothetical protein BSR46_12500 [Candidatus Dactylopiibacterium carminicum]